MRRGSTPPATPPNAVRTAVNKVPVSTLIDTGYQRIPTSIRTVGLPFPASVRGHCIQVGIHGVLELAATAPIAAAAAAAAASSSTAATPKPLCEGNHVLCIGNSVLYGLAHVGRHVHVQQKSPESLAGFGDDGRTLICVWVGSCRGVWRERGGLRQKQC